MMPSPAFCESDKTELYCWPFFGIIANISKDSNNVGFDGNYCEYWMRKFSEYKPLGIETLLDVNLFTELIVVRFDGDWSDFKNALEFDKSFQARGRGREEWIQRRTSPGCRPYGWIAREDDYNSEGPLGNYLHSNGALKTVSELIQEATMDRQKILSNLVDEINSRNIIVNQLRNNYNQKRISTVKMLQDHDIIYRNFDEGTMKLQRISWEHTKGVLEEQEMLKFELERQRQCLNSWKKDLNKREEALNERERRTLEVENIKIELRKREDALIEKERQILEEQNIKNDLINNVLQMTVEERRKADENVGELIEVQKREKEALEKVLELERKLDEKHKLKPEIEELKDQINDLQILYHDLLVKERQCNDELQGARKELINGLNNMMTGCRAKIGIKRMGEIDARAFKKRCNERFPPEDAETRALQLCSLWQEKLNNPHWHPFRVVENDEGIHERLLNEDDELLRGLKDEWGEDIYDAVVMALKDLQEYNPSGCYLVSEFWNFKENRKATFKEVIGHICSQLKTLKRKRV